MQNKSQALRLISVLRKDLVERYNEACQLSSLMSTPAPISESLKMWRIRAVDEIDNHISQVEARNLEARDLNNFGYVDVFNIPTKQFQLYDGFLTDLADAIEADPTSVLQVVSQSLTSEEKEVATSHPKKDVIFIVYGHDEANMYRLKELLKDRFHLDFTTLSSKPGSGQTLIEKFEREARLANFAFVLLTPDDMVQKGNTNFSQARPNVIFELGWFYGHLGRERVCVLVRKDTNINSDLAGISRIEFSQVVNEKLEEIEEELIAGGLLEA